MTVCKRECSRNSRSSAILRRPGRNVTGEEMDVSDPVDDEDNNRRVAPIDEANFIPRQEEDIARRVIRFCIDAMFMNARDHDERDSCWFG